MKTLLLLCVTTIALAVPPAAAQSAPDAAELTKLLHAIEGLDRTLNEAGHPYMSKAVADQAGI